RVLFHVVCWCFWLRKGTLVVFLMDSCKLMHRFRNPLKIQLGFLFLTRNTNIPHEKAFTLKTAVVYSILRVCPNHIRYVVCAECGLSGRHKAHIEQYHRNLRLDHYSAGL